MSAKLNRRPTQLELFQPRKTRPALRKLPVQIQKKTVSLLVELLAASRNAQRNEKEACDE